MAGRKGAIRNGGMDNEVTFTKCKVNFLLFVGVIGASMPYVLSIFGKDPVEDLGKFWITEIVAVILGYMLKAYNGKKQEEKQKLDNYKAQMRYGNENTDGAEG